MKEELDLVDRVRTAGWPGPNGLDSARSLRRRAGRRKAVRTAVAATCVAAAVGAGFAFASNSDEARPVATDPAGENEVIEFEGVTFELPSGWRLSRTEVPGVACLLPAGEARTEPCAIEFAVTPNPELTLVEGLDPVRALTSDCAAGDPRLVDVTHMTVDNRRASVYTGRCDASSSPATVWALDNRSVYVLTRDSAQADSAAGIFESIGVPDDWPEPDLVEGPSPTPSQD